MLGEVPGYPIGGGRLHRSSLADAGVMTWDPAGKGAFGRTDIGYAPVQV